MRDPHDLSRPAPMRRLFVLGLVFVAAILSCGKDVTGPLGAAARYVRGLAFAPQFPPAYQAVGGSSSGVVQFTKVHVVLHHSDGTVALDTTIDFPANADSLTVDLTVKLLPDAPADGEPMTLNLGYLNAAGDTVFKGGPVSLTASPPPAGGGPNPPVKVPVSYSGPGFTATSVLISPRGGTVVAGSGFSFSAVAKDQNGVVLPATPIIWNSVDPTIATITSPAAGNGTAQGLRGTARIIAQLFSGAADTVQLNVTLPASQIILQSGNVQTGVVGTNLAAPIVVKVAASDGVGVANTTVSFAVASGGGSVTNASVLSDANGLAQTTLKLGTVVGANSVTATATGLTNSPLTFTATAQAATATKLVVTTQPVNGVAGIALTNVVFTAEDNNGNIATSFNGLVNLAFGANSTGATLSGTATVNAIAGVATFSNLLVNKNGTAYTLVASSTGLTSATTNTFDVAVGAPKQLVFSVQPPGAIANVAMSPAIVVNAQDSQGNPTPAFTSAVTLSFAVNTTGATLGGTATVNAVAGVATFSGISVSAAGTGYALSASSTGLTSVTSALFNVGGGVATTMVVASGAGQTGNVSSVLALPIVIQVNDVGANPVPGTTVNFAVVTGGGSVLPVSGISNAAGQVQTTWTLGATVGAQSISATSAGLAGSPLTVNATAAVGAATQLVITVQPTNTVAGVAIAPAITVTAKDALNNTVPSYVANVSLAFGANPGGSTLGGVTTIAAVAGVATFNGVSLNKAAAGYTLVASSGALTTATTNAFNITPGAAQNLAITAGQGQSGFTSTALGTALGVIVTDANVNAVAGVTVNWATAGGATVLPTSSVTNAAGVATTIWTLGSTPGAQTATATSGVLAGSPATFNATATVAGFSKTWTGATSTTWAVATNWSPVGVPVAGDSVFIPSGGNQPSISAAVTLKHLTIAAGALLSFVGSPAVTITGNLTDNGGMAGNGTMVLSGAGTLSGGVSPSLTISGTYSLAGAASAVGATLVTGSLNLNGHALGIAVGSFSTTGSGTITMMNAADALTVNGNATFGGGAETGLLTNGVMTVSGNFLQNGATINSFDATSAHNTIFSGASAQSITVSNPATSRFGSVTFGNTAGATLLSNIQITGQAQIAGAVTGAAFTVTIGSTLTDAATNLSVGNVIFPSGGSTNPVSGSTPTINANVTFNNNPSLLLGNLTINGIVNVGGNLQLSSHYLVINGDFSTAGAGQLTMATAADSMLVSGNATFGGGSTGGTLTNGKLKIGGNFSQVNNGSGTEFSGTASHITLFTGATPSISFASPATSSFGKLWLQTSAGASFATSALVNGLVWLKTGTTPSVTGASATVTIGGALYDTTGGRWQVANTTTTGAGPLPRSLNTNLTITANLALTDSLKLTGATNALAISTGNLTLGGHYVIVPGAFSTAGTGTIQMTNAHDSLVVQGSASFGGGSTAGKLTNGYLEVDGASFSQSGAVNAFEADNPHTTYFAGIVPITVTFANTGGGVGASHFGTLSLADTATYIASNILVVGKLGTAVVATHFVHGGTALNVTSDGADVSHLTFDGPRWVLLDTYPVVTMDNVTFQNMDPTVIQMTVQRSGAGAMPNFNNWIFSTVPTTGDYLQTFDTDGIAPFLTVTMVSPTPTSSGGFTVAGNNSVINGWTGPASHIAISAGQAQSGAISSVLPTPLAVTVTDANSNLVSGTTVNWAIVTGGGGVAPASSVTNAAGVATTTWTLGASAGVQTVSATSGSLAGSPLTFTANASTALANKTWTGATNNQWALASNWSPAVIPVGTDSVFIPLVSTLPTLSASTTVASLYIASGATLTLAGGGVTLTDNGELDATGPITGGGNISLGGAPGRHLRGIIGGAVTIGGTYTQNGTLTVTGNVVVGSGGALTLNGNVTTINGSFSTTGTGTITMTSGGDVLSVFGPMTFSGGAETGLITAGTINLTGNFTQSVTAASFAASTNNTVVFSGTTPQTVTFSNTGSSHFQNVSVANSTGVAMATSGVVMAGNVVVGVGGIAGAGSLQIGGTLTDGSGLVTVNTVVFSGNAPVSATTPTLQVPIVRFTGAAAALAANLTVNGKAVVDINGVFSPNGHTLTTTGNFETQSNGKLSMTGASDAVVVQSGAIFGGGSTAGLLTNGTLTVFGDFSQTGATSTASFQAVAPHLTLLNSSFGTENISFSNPDTILTGACTLSCFGNFTVAKTAGTLAINSMASAGGNVAINAGVTAVTATHFLLVKGSTTTAAGTNVHVTRFGSFGSLSLDASTIADTIQFHGSAAQVIPPGTYNEMVIKGSPTIGVGGFTTDGGLTVDGGVFTLGGKAVSVTGAFLTTHGGTLVMNTPTDSLLVVGQATFGGGVETGQLTDGTLFVLTGITVSGPSQFNASGNHVTYLVGPNLGCECTDIQHPIRGGVDAILGLAVKKQPHGRLAAAALAARRAAGALAAKDARAKSAALQKAHNALASKWTSRANAVRAAIAGRTVRTPVVGQRGAPVAASTRGPVNIRIRAPGTRSSTLNVAPQSSNPITVSFGDSTSNQFANLRVMGSADWQTFARVAGKVRLDATTDLEGAGHIAIGDTLFGVSNSNVEMTSVELFGVLADTGFFEPDTTVFSGALQTIPTYVGSGQPSYNNVVVNSAELDRMTDDNELEIEGSLFIMNSGQLRLGAPDPNCVGCESDLYVDGNFETHNAGILRMNDVPLGSAQDLVVYGNALFAGGSTSGLLTQGEVDYYANFTQSGPTTDSYAATSPHYSYFGASSGTQIINFANPAYASSHFGDLYLGDPSTTLQSNTFVDGQLSFGHVAAHTVTGTNVSITSKGASVRDVLFDGVSWTLLDGYPVDDMDAVEFSNQVATGTQFTITRNGAGSLPNFTSWTFSTAPAVTTGQYMSINDTNGATNTELTVNMVGVSPSSNAGKVTLTGGAVLNGWFNLSAATWLGINTDWNSTANWNTGVVPNSGTDVTINCDCSAPTTTAVSAVHNLTLGGSGITLTLGASSPLTVNGDLSIAAFSNIDVSTTGLTLLGNVVNDTSSSFGGITCGTGSAGATISGGGAHNVRGKFCRLAIAGTVVASGKILVKNTTPGGAGLTVQSGGSLDLYGNKVETDSMYTTGTGTITMTHSVDSLVIHGANVAVPVSFAGGSETGLMTAGVVDLKSPKFTATGTSFDATGTQVFVADSNTTQNIRWVSPVQGHGFNNAVFKYPQFKIFSVTSGNSVYFNGSVVLDPTMGPSGGQLDATGVHLYFGSLTDNSGIAAGAVFGAFWLHLTSSGALTAPVQVDSLFFESGGNMSLTNNLTFTGAVVVQPDFRTSTSTGLYLSGHLLKTNNQNFVTTGTAFLAMTNSADSLDVGTGSVFFNGGDGFGTYLNKGGIAAGGFYQGYTNTTTLASGAAASSYNPSGTHRIWLTGNSKVIFANPGTGSSASHFNSMHNAGGFTTTLYSDVFVDDSLYLGSSGISIASDGPTNAAKTRLMTTKGLGNNTTAQNASFSNVSLKWVDGQAAPTNFDGISWTNFPLLFTGTVFEVNRSTSTAPTLASHNFLSVFISALLGTGKFVNNTSPVGGPTLSFTGVTGLLDFSLLPGTSNP